MSKGMAVIRELGSMEWFNPELTTAATKILYHTYLRILIIYRVIVCTTCDTTCKTYALLQVQLFKTLLKLKRAPS